MKRTSQTISLLVCLFGGWLAGAQTKDESGRLRAGAAAVDISPTPGVSLDGLLQKHGPIKRVEDPLFARCVALANGANRLVIVMVDACVMSGDLIDRAKELTRKETGFPSERMLVAATHTHMAPRLAGWTDSEIDREYYGQVVRGIATAVGQALERFAPAKLGWASVDRKEFLKNRRWIMKPGTIGLNPFGETGDLAVMGGSPAKDRVRPAGPVDPAFTVVSVRHLDDRPLALLANFGIHYGTNQKGVASADYFGRFAKQVEAGLAADADHRPVVALMSNGASADIGARGGDFERMRQFADSLARDALQLTGKISHRSDVVLAMAESRIELGVRKPGAGRLAWASKVLSSKSKGSAHRWTRIFAEEAVHLAEFPDAMSIRLQALRLGDLGIVGIPGEVFAGAGLALRRDSPLKTTMTISHANDWHGYIPTPEQHDLGGMEVWPRRASYLEREASEKIHAELNRMLRALTAPD